MATEEQQQEEQLKQQTHKWARSRGQALLLSISTQQSATNTDFPARGPQWVSRTVLKAPSDGQFIGTAIQKAIKGLGDGSSTIPDIQVVDVNAQWTGYKPSAQAKETEPEISEEAKYEGLLKDVTSETTILYAHGGYFYTGGAANSRFNTLPLVRETGGRCLAVNYRLAPQNPFPAAIVDLFVAYLSLLYPDENALHKPVKPEHIVFAGESSGGNLVLSLLSLLQYWRDNEGGRIVFRGKEVAVPLPAGIATLCAHTDLTSSSASQLRNKSFDIFYLDHLPYLLPDFPADHLWPTDPPRGDIYCNTHELVHPLVSVEISPSWSASDLPPMFFAYGQEMIIDEGRHLAEKARKAGTIVQFQRYDALPHVFPMLFPKLPQSQHALKEWARFCHQVVYKANDLENQDVRFKTSDKEFKGSELKYDVNTDDQQRLKEMKEKIAPREPWTGSGQSSRL